MKQSSRQLFLPLGRVNEYQVDNNSAKVITENAQVELTFYSEKTIRVCAYSSESKDQVSYAVIAEPDSAVVPEIGEDPQYCFLKTKELCVSIDKQNAQMRFYDGQQRLINQDADGLGIGWQGEEVSCFKKINPNERFLGLGEKTGSLDRRGQSFTNWNTDYFAYPTDGDPLYCSIPFYIGVNNGLLYGIFFDNSYRSRFNFGASNNRFISFSADGGDLNYYFVTGTSIPEILYEYGQLTGMMELPPMWSLGYQQCRYSYYPDKDVVRLAETFRDKQIPCDVIYLDIHYMDAYKVFTWDKNRFPDPKAMLAKLKRLGFKVVVIMDPGIKVEEGYEAYDTAKKLDLFVKYPDGSDYEGEVWPGWCNFPDYTQAKAREWWAESMKDYVDVGLEGFWNDMNEFATWGQDMPHMLEFGYEGERSTAKRARNVYGMEMARATKMGAEQHRTGKRPFILTRAGFAGIQRYAAVWTGDNVSYDDHMLVGIRMVASLGLSGVPFSGYDIGGFVGEPSPDLFARWMALATFCPFFRGHTMINSRTAEPWAFGEKTEEISRNYINLRYRLLPYIYSAFYEASQTGMPVARSMALYYPFEQKTYEGDFQNQFFFGSNLLVVPIASGTSITKIFLPEGNWYSLLDDRYFQGNQVIYWDTPITEVPVFVRESAIIPMQQLQQNTNEAGGDTLELHLYKGQVDGQYELYEDAGDGHDYQSGTYALRKIEFSAAETKWTISEQEGSYSSKWQNVRFYFHGLERTITSITINGNQVELTDDSYGYIEPISKFDPFLPAEEQQVCQVKTAEVSWEKGEMVIKQG